MMHQSRMYRYNEYRVTDDGLQVCNSSDPPINQRWQDLIALEKEVLASKHCNGSAWTNFTIPVTHYTKILLFSSNLLSRVSQGKITEWLLDILQFVRQSLVCPAMIIWLKWNTAISTTFCKTFRCFTTTRCTIILSIDSETKVLKCVLPMIQEFGPFGKLDIRGKSLKTSINAADLRKKFMQGTILWISSSLSISHLGVNISQETTMGWKTVNLTYAKKTWDPHHQNIPRKIY